MPGSRCAQPRSEFLVNIFILPKPNDYLPVQAHSARKESKLAIAMRRLVQIHEVHVDGRPRQILIELSVQVDERLLQRLQSADPHLCRRKGMNPGDQTDAVLRAIGL